MSDAVEVPAGFEYVPTKGVHSRWVMWVDDEPVDQSCTHLSDVEEAVETWVDDELEDREIEILRVSGSHGWRVFELSDDSVIRFRWTYAPIDFRCAGCGGDTSDEGYMVHDDVWAQAGFESGWVCVGCMEGRLDRPLISTDFKADLPMNTDYYTRRSARLRDRLGDLLVKPDTGPKITYDAPVASIDLRAFDDDGNPFPVHPCHNCLPWHAEVVKDPESGEILVREWHAWECGHLQELLADD